MRLALAWFGFLAALGMFVVTATATRHDEEMPMLLSQTGLYVDIERRMVAGDVLAYEPNFPLWTDGADKRRWIRLPEGSAIDARHVDRWDFPVGTRLWKEFALDDAIETRMLTRRADGSWSFASYRWDANGHDAELVPATGQPAAAQVAEGIPYDIPSRADCLSCHGRSRNAVLGFSAVQLSDELIAELQDDGRLQDYASPTVATRNETGLEASLRGYLHGNCGHCHDGEGAMQRPGFRLDLRLQDAANVSAFPIAGDPEQMLLRLTSDDPLKRMPPLGTHRTDPAAIELFNQWLSWQGTQPQPSQGALR